MTVCGDEKFLKEIFEAVTFWMEEFCLNKMEKWLMCFFFRVHIVVEQKLGLEMNC